MIILIPIFYDDQCFWDTVEGRNMLVALFERLAKNAPARIVLVSDRSEILKLGQGFGFDGLPVTEPGPEESPFPVGTDVSLKALNGTQQAVGDVLVLNFRNPMMGGKLLHQAVREFGRTGKEVLASVVPPRDHPCQIQSCLRLAQTVVVHLEDVDNRPDWLPDDWAVTRSFFHDWEYEGVKQDGIFHREKGLYGVANKAVDFEGDSDVPVWIRTSATVACIAYPRGDGEAGFVRRTGFPMYGVSCLWQPDGSVSLRVERKVSGSRVNIKVYPYSMGEVSTKAVRAHDMIENSVSGIIPVSHEGWQGFLVRVFEVIESGMYDLSEMFRPAGAPWFVRGDGKTVNIETNAIIQGRQQMPGVYDVDGSLFILRKGSSLPARNRLLDVMHPVVIEQCYSMHLESRLDFLQFRAKKRSVANA